MFLVQLRPSPPSATSRSRRCPGAPRSSIGRPRTLSLDLSLCHVSSLRDLLCRRPTETNPKCRQHLLSADRGGVFPSSSSPTSSRSVVVSRKNLQVMASEQVVLVQVLVGDLLPSSGAGALKASRSWPGDQHPRSPTPSLRARCPSPFSPSPTNHDLLFPSHERVLFLTHLGTHPEVRPLLTISSQQNRRRPHRSPTGRGRLSCLVPCCFFLFRWNQMSG